MLEPVRRPFQKISIDGRRVVVLLNQLDLVLAGARDAWKIKERLAEEGVPVILGMVAALPPNDAL